MAYKFNPFTGTLDDVGAGGGGGTPGGSTTQVQFNDGGAFAGDADLVWNKTTNVLGITGDVNLSDGGTYTTTLQTITPTADRTISLPDATGTVALVAGSSGQLLWNNAGVNAGISGSSVTAGGNVTLNQVLVPNGTTTNPGFAFSANTDCGFIIRSTNQVCTVVDGVTKLEVNGNGCIISGTNPQSFGWSSDITAASPDLFLLRDAANTLAQRNGTNAQTSRVYNTYTSSTNYELGKLEWSSNVFRIGTEAGGGGGTLRAMELNAGVYININLAGTNKFGIGGSSNISYQKLEFASDNLYDIGSPATTRPRHIYAGSSITGPHNLQGSAPATASSTGTAGDIRYDASYIYICTATDTWKRAAISTW